MTQRPSDTAPGGMRGATRMHDPSEAAHDRLRRRLMNGAFVVILAATIVQLRWVSLHGWDWLNAVLLIVAGAPLGLGIKIFELRFKMATAERRLVLRELPAQRKLEFTIYGALAMLLLMSRPFAFTWELWGVWLYDFVTYYHDRPERMRHLYAVTKTLDELRSFRAPWAWALPALVFEVARRIL